MATIRRMRTVATPPPTTNAGQVQAQVQQTTTAVKAVRRFIGGVSTKPNSQSAARAAIAAQLQLIATNNGEIDKLVETNDIATSAIEQLMQRAGLTEEEAAGLRAVYAEVFSRASRTVDPKLFREKVNDDAKFMQAVEVPIGKAKDFLGEKELETVCAFFAAKTQGFKLRVEEVKTKVTRGKIGG